LERSAAELSEMPVDVIVTDSGAASIAAKKVTHSVPIVMGVVSDPVGLGLVASLARPGGNVTGFSIISPELGSKRLGLLKEAVPKAKLVGVLLNPSSPATGAQQLAPIKDAAASLAVELAIAEAHGSDNIPSAIDGLVAGGVSALMIVGDAVFFTYRKLIVEHAETKSLPAIFPEREYTEAGGLMSYGPNVPDNLRRAAVYVTRILKRKKAGDLPIEQPVKFDLAINVKTAKTLGVDVPATLLARADEVIE